MKFKKEKLPSNYEHMRIDTVQFLENEKASTEITHENNVGKIYINTDDRLHAGKEVVNKIEYFKGNVHDFITNEKIFTEITHENNVGKIKYKLNILLEDDSIKQEQKPLSSSNGNITSISTKEYSNMEQTHRRVVEEDVQQITTSVVTNSRVDYSGSTPKKYKTTCYLEPKTVPTWYTESLLLKLDSTKKVYSEQVYFKSKLQPTKWSESMTTNVQHHVNEIRIPITKSDVHYISLEPQQISVK
ncbi:uncharacterized protein LOC109600474 isoform X1 [Aethina tumida]|uniref:uncharacterized protein LOC109600474 isoform X1 n=1 Tax=Aethina tumida TaxID=116153 RepID=UPI00096B2B3C|nr:uncharacterized protein LOC109600474 isoform X1 [Aethina tumida]